MSETSLPGRLWLLRNWTGWKPAGFGCDEYGRATVWVRVPFAGALVWAYRWMTREEVLRRDPEFGPIAWADIEQERREAGIMTRR